MAKKASASSGGGKGSKTGVAAFDHGGGGRGGEDGAGGGKGAKRKNNPPARLASEGTVPVLPKAVYSYNPHLPPVLRFDSDGEHEALLKRAAAGALKPQEIERLRGLLGAREPWLEWTGKRERPSFAVDPVALHIHERISAQAIVKLAARQDVTRSLFADPEQEYKEAVQFYKHEIDWTNRLILGDSLEVMSSLSQREELAGKVQMIYMDPPYGIKFGSNFQPEVGKRDVKDKQEDLTREPEMVRAYRDTWHLGIHSYLSYLRDRLIVARELLADTGSIFVQISDENLHRVRNVMDEVFGADNFCALICYGKTSGLGSKLLYGVFDYVLWYARDQKQVKYQQLYYTKVAGETGATKYSSVMMPDGQMFPLGDESLPPNGQLFTLSGMNSQGNPTYEYPFRDRVFADQWKTNVAGLDRLSKADRIEPLKTTLRYVRYIRDFACSPINNSWYDVGGIQSRSDPKVYVVQTSTTAIQRCMLMTTDPGDLVLDPTCGSGTTAYVAEQWGRRWITTDTSRVALAIARQRLLTAKFEQYKTKGNNPLRPADGFVYKTVPHITLKSIAQNVALDPIFAKHEPRLEAALAKANTELAAAIKKDPTLVTTLANKAVVKERNEGKRSVTDADRRRWILPPKNRAEMDKAKATVDLKFAGWYHWEMPFDADPDYPKGLAEAVVAYRAAWRAKMDDVNACIAASAEQEELVDQP